MLAGGGAFGALGRYVLTEFIQPRLHARFPDLPLAWGTLTVNYLGCFLIGLALHLISKTGPIPHEARFLFVVGFLGAFTTFSTFSLETLNLLRDGDYLIAVVYVLASVLGGLALVAAGMMLGKAIG